MRRIIVSFCLSISVMYFVINLSSFHKASSCDGVTPTYTEGVSTILNKNCALSGCHVSGFVNGDFSTYSGAQSKKDDIKNMVEKKLMPPTGGLSDSDIQTISCWVENDCPE